MRILVDKIPEEANKCLLSCYNHYMHKHECLFEKDNAFDWKKACYLENNEQCPYLAEIK